MADQRFKIKNAAYSGKQTRGEDMARPDQTLNLQHLDNPLEGDYWHEMCCVYHVVLKVLTNGNLVIANRQNEKDGQWFDFKNAHEITKAEHTKLVRYKGIDGFVADVVVASTPGMAAVSEWRDMYLGKYKSVADRDIVGPAATVEEIREALDTSIIRMLGGTDIDSFLAAVPAEKQLGAGFGRRAEIDNAFAIAFGFADVADMTAKSALTNLPLPTGIRK